MDNKTLSDLIGLIYDVAADASLWPQLLQMLADELNPFLVEATEKNQLSADDIHDDPEKTAHLESMAYGTRAQTKKLCTRRKSQLSQITLINLLSNHITRALELNRRIFDAHEEINEMQDFFERLPLGMLIVDGASQVLTCNRKLNSILSEEKGISVKNNVLCANSSEDTKRLRQTVRTAADDRNRAGETLHLFSPDMDIPLSVLILPFNPDSAMNGKEKNKVVVLVAAPGMKMEISPETLQSFYQLTKAEAKLVSALICDRDLNSIARDFGISKNTARNQLKSVYEKTGTHRQAELVRQVITGPAMLATIYGQDKAASHPRPVSGILARLARPKKMQNQTLKLPDGRHLGFAEYGAADGRPVMLMHSFNGSRLERHPDETIIERCGIRLIIPDRPGVGLSDHQQHLTLLSWADDVACLADHLEIKKFNLIGYSMGAPFSLACAYRLKKRIGRVAIACGIAPFDSIWELAGMYLPARMMLSLCRHANALLAPLVRFIGVQAPPEEYLKDLWQHLPPVDRALICDPAIQNRILENARENSRRGDLYILQEVVLISRGWGFELGQIEAPVEIWHGELDRLAPPGMARKMANKFHNCRTHFLPGAGHYLMFHCWKDILLSAISEDKQQKKPSYSPYGSCFSR